MLSELVEVRGLVSASVTPVAPEVANVTAQVLSVLSHLMPVAAEFPVIRSDFPTIRTQLRLRSAFVTVLPILTNIRSQLAADFGVRRLDTALLSGGLTPLS
jgi:hypothetical protein